jgi:hypothetical protein
MDFNRPYRLRRMGLVNDAYTHPVATAAIVSACLLFGIAIFAVGLVLFSTVRI